MWRLSPEALDFAQAHIKRYWDSDFYPKPFEFAALWSRWPDVRAYLSGTDIRNLEVRLPRVEAAPKPNHTFRVVHQLDPLNTLAYTAMAYLVAPAVERARVAPDRYVACSYRVVLDGARGMFFEEGSGYEMFVAQSRALAGAHPFVLVTDLTDFYNQIYLHRLQNAIAVADPTLTDLAGDIEDFLTRLNDRVSHGVPVGPVASIIMAEAVLMDIDNFLIERGFYHTRYVDDFHIFGNSEGHLRGMLADLTLYLHRSHRLVLAGDKTDIVPSADFVHGTLDSPEEIERREIHSGLAAIRPSGIYPPPEQGPDGLTADERVRVLRELMDRVCAMEVLDLGLARHVLRRCRRYRLRTIVPQLFDHFDFFAPVINDVVLYLSSVTTRSFLEHDANRLYEVLTTSPMARCEFVRFWLAHYVVQHPSLVQDERFRRFVLYGALEFRADVAIVTRSVALARELRGQMDQVGTWDRRQIIRSSIVLARDERTHWYRNLEQNPLSLLENWVLSWAKAQN